MSQSFQRAGRKRLGNQLPDSVLQASLSAQLALSPSPGAGISGTSKNAPSRTLEMQAVGTIARNGSKTLRRMRCFPHHSCCGPCLSQVVTETGVKTVPCGWIHTRRVANDSLRTVGALATSETDSHTTHEPPRSTFEGSYLPMEATQPQMFRVIKCMSERIFKSDT